MLRRLAPFALSAALPAQSLIWPGEDVATLDAEHLRAYVPAASADRLKPLIARADQILAHMQADAGFVPDGKLRLLVADWLGDHNGFSFVTPFPLVQIELAPSLPESTIFAGGHDAERTLIHEFAHELSNDRNAGFRGALESVFGRVLPNDVLSLLLWYLSTPAHQTMPRFWQEGLGVWAETSYADPNSVWAGRGRDPLTHMVWRLDAAAGGIPDESEWRITQHEWPFGGAAYTYGTAYLRWLEGNVGERAAVWRLVQDQADMWPFLYDRGPRQALGRRHQALLATARRALQAEQEANLALLRGAAVTATQRKTPEDMLVAAPAWQDFDLVFAAKPAQGRARLHTLHRSWTLGPLQGSNTPTLALGAMRALPDGGVVYHEFNWRGIGKVVLDGHAVGWRLLQPDATARCNGERVLVAIRLRDGGGQDLVRFVVRDGELDAGAVVPTENVPWSPALRPGSDHGGELAWVETDDQGSQLVLGSLPDGAARRVLWRVRGRILHPVWTADGRALFCCADHTGVANAWHIDLAGTEPNVRPVTNVLGGVVACVPSPDGRELAIVDHDHRGPFVALLSADPTTWVQTVPTIELPWPAPRGQGGAEARPGQAPAAHQPTPIPPLPAGAADALVAEPYSGLAELRPRFWAPSTFAVPTGGYGAYGLLCDPLLTNVVELGAGIGYVEQEPVGFVGYSHLGSTLEYGFAGGRSELTFAETVRRGGTLYDYTETVAGGEVRVGRGLYALERTFVLYGACGIESHDEVDDAARKYAGGTYVKAPFRDVERYVEARIGYDDSTFYPTSYWFEDGFRVLASYRHSGLGGDLDRNRALADAGYTWSLFPAAGHQLVLRAQAGWSDGDDTLQGNFSIGGGLSTGLPRGYYDSAVATGRHLLAGSLAYRFPLWRPFVASSTTPFRGRQLVLELFGDTAQISDDHLGGDGDWFTSVGGELHANFEFADGILNPGIGVAAQLDGERDVRAWFTLGFSY